MELLLTALDKKNIIQLTNRRAIAYRCVASF
ncbi:hypothetical protein cce_1111 [Crocosphaera subtropica ATCC 51142]|uniref:Uncharacterized protein n=1 Tax=Crocosphaera subtropica (strain ATCC 51142 / BH68) TaxID=43989 RepID=B1WTZ5_CROS5|nr:hypothetical protein cce_1111 [Crocosphaera subtropica ATCC 51142]